MRLRHITLALALATSAATLTACGTGSGAAPAAPAAPAPAAAPALAAAPAPGSTTPVGPQFPAPGGADLSLLGGTAQANGASAGTGDAALPTGGPVTVQIAAAASQWVQLSAGSAGRLGPVVHNGAGLTLYRFDEDVPGSGVSACDQQCASTWPPVVVSPGGKIFVDGVDPSQVGLLPRGNGSYQVTLGGMPLYRFAQDSRPGETTGQGVNGTWFAATPTGAAAGSGSATGGAAGSGAYSGGGSAAGGSSSRGSAGGASPRGGSTSGAAPAPDPAAGRGSSTGQGSSTAQGSGAAAGQVAAATSAILFDEARFSDTGASQGVAGTGCQDLSRPGVASSISVTGRLKLWAQAGCTGESIVVTSDVPDLSAVGFDDAAASVRLG